MDDLPLPGLLPGDPKNRLSVPARRRWWLARIESDRIRWEAQAEVEARQLTGKKAKYVVNRADLQAARTVLEVLSEEYTAAGLTLREFWNAMRAEIEDLATSLALYDSQSLLLQVEFFTPKPKVPVGARHPSAIQSAPVDSKPAIESQTVAAQVNRLREECHLTIEELAEKIDMDVRTVERHIAGKIVPYAQTIRAYEKVFSKLLNKQIVISKMPGRCR